jgi:hypothetical protein
VQEGLLLAHDNFRLYVVCAKDPGATVTNSLAVHASQFSASMTLSVYLV